MMSRDPLREALDAMADTLNVIDGVLDDTHPEGHDCDLCRVMDEVPVRWLAVVDAARAASSTQDAAARFRADDEQAWATPGLPDLAVEIWRAAILRRRTSR